VTATLDVLGIRHHGPGSARAVARALDEVRPDAVLIEGPPELDGVAAHAAGPGMAPPVAGLVYAVDEPRRASFYPMAVFSPEWVALRWALAAGVEVAFADLPCSQRLCLDPESDHGAAGDDPAETDRPATATATSAGHGPGPDPIAQLATAAGYDDPERWWEDAVEQRHPGHSAMERFAAIAAAIAELRASTSDDQLILRREAAMRRRLRAAVKAHQRVVFVCGAYHAPVVARDTWPTVASDDAWLKGLARTKVAATWAPWTSARLAQASGYGAGVTSPGWYHHLFTTSDDTVARWLVRVAGALRGEGFDVSPAAVVEASRMAEALAALRGRPLAGLSELNDATVSVLCHGSDQPLRLVGRQLIVGTDLGSVPDGTPTVPLARDLEQLQRRLRMRPSAEERAVVLDLRHDGQRQRSVLLHRLAILGVHWGVPADAGRTTGTFKEGWIVQWRPELSVDLIEASLYGTTVSSAAAAKAADDAERAESLGDLARLVDRTLTADLGAALDDVVAALDMRAAHQHDARILAETIEPLARTRRYGDVRGTDTTAIDRLVHVLGTRAAVGLPSACASLDDDAAASCRAAIESASAGIALLDDGGLRDEWERALAAVSTRQGVHGSVAGRVNRLLLDAGRLGVDEAARRLSRVLSVAADPLRAAAWLDGFLAGDALLLVHDRALLGVIDEWIASVPDGTFDDLLPLLRRAFSRYQRPERRRIAEQLARGPAGPSSPPSTAGDVDLERAAAALATVARMLGC
jgi:hypothetical protein